MLIFSKIFLSPKFNAITIWPFIILKDRFLKKDKLLLHHERIHLRQQIEMLVLPFFVWYLLEFLIRFILTQNWMKAYFSISFEKEAYTNEKNLTYLRSRKFWSFIKYM